MSKEEKINKIITKIHPLAYEDDYDDDNEDELMECNDECSHYDKLNQCCWIATEKGLCRTVNEGDLCIYGFMKEIP